VKTPGFDTIARKGSEVLLVDNKAYLSRGTVSSASALTKNLSKNVDAALAQLERLAASGVLSEAESQAVAESIKALEKGTFQRTITGAGGIVKGIGRKLAASGIIFKALSAVLAVASFSLDASTTGYTPFEESLTNEEFQLYLRWMRGEDIFGAGKSAIQESMARQCKAGNPAACPD